MKTPLLSLVLLAGATTASFSAEAPKAVKAQLITLLESTQDNDLERFESVCNETMQKTMTPEILNKVSAQLSGVMREGYAIEFMGFTDRILTMTYYWKIDFKTERVPDQLIEVSITGDKVAGFFIR